MGCGASNPQSAAQDPVVVPVDPSSHRPGSPVKETSADKIAGPAPPAGPGSTMDATAPGDDSFDVGDSVSVQPVVDTVVAANGQSLAVGSRIIIGNTKAPDIHGQPGAVHQVLSGEDAGRVLVVLESGDKINIKAYNLYADECGCGENHHTPDAGPPCEGWHKHRFDDGTSYAGDFKNGMRHGHGIAVSADGYKFDGGWFVACCIRC